MAQRKSKKALKNYEKAIEVNPKDSSTWYNKGLALYEIKNFEEAIKAYDKVTEINPQNSNAWYNKGLAFYEIKNFEEAIKAYDKVIEINPQNSDAWYNKGLALYEIKNFEEAIKAYDKVIEINPQNSDAWYNKGLTLFNLKKYDEAIKSYEKAIEINSEKAYVWYTLHFSTKLFEFPGFGWAKQKYESRLLTNFKSRLDNLKSISIVSKSPYQHKVIDAVEKVIAVETLNEVIYTFYKKTSENLFYFGFLIISLFYFIIMSDLSIYIFALIIMILSIIPLAIFQKFKLEKFYRPMILLYLFFGFSLTTLEIVWLNPFIKNSIMVGFLFIGTLWLIFESYFYLFLRINEFIFRKFRRREPEADIIDSLIFAVAFAKEKPGQRSENEIKDSLLNHIEIIAQTIENDLSQRFSSYDIETNAWFYTSTREIATGIRFLKRCVLFPKEESREWIEVKLETMLVNVIDGNWDLFERMEPPSLPSWSSRAFEILRRLTAAIIPLLIVGIIVLSPIKLNETIMGYIIAGSIGWVALVMLSWLDPDYYEKLETFTDKSNIIPRKKRK